MIAKICYIEKNTGIEKIEIFAMHSNFRYHSEISSIANFGTVPHWLLFHWSQLHFSSIFYTSLLLVFDL